MIDNEILQIAVKALHSKNGHDLKIIRIADITTIANYFVIATGTSSTQVKTLADEAEQKLKIAGVTPRRTENHRGADWIVLDYIDVVIHVFYGETRDFYDLERLWQDGEELDAKAFL